jgi:hypothetical protein
MPARTFCHSEPFSSRSHDENARGICHFLNKKGKETSLPYLSLPFRLRRLRKIGNRRNQLRIQRLQIQLLRQKCDAAATSFCIQRVWRGHSCPREGVDTCGAGALARDLFSLHVIPSEALFFAERGI